jgi:hypothetical protein
VATEKQIAANRNNSMKSTGPKTQLGKVIASRNSTRHAFYETTVVLKMEDRKEFVRFSRRLVQAYAPCGILEEEQVKSIIETRWQLRRANQVDSELFQIYSIYENEQRDVGTAFAQDATQGNAFSKLTRYQGSLLRTMQTAEKELARLQTVRSGGPSNATASGAPVRSPKGQGSLVVTMPECANGDAAAQRLLKWLRQPK